MQQIFDSLKSLSGTAIAVVLVALVFLIAQRLLISKITANSKFVPLRRAILFTLGFVGALFILMVLPIGNELRGQIFSFLGIILSAGVALSSTTLLGNALAAVMMRFVNHFQVGDFVETDDSFGRVTNRGIFHTEVQTAHRDLKTIPNLYLATKPVTVIRSSGTIVSGTVSLGYDVPRTRIEKSLLAAAERVGLKDPFVFVMELGDFSVTYKVHGLLEDISVLLSTRSKLYKAMLDQLHKDNIEIVSPTFMNQKKTDGQVFIPLGTAIAEVEEEKVEAIIFDKAEMAKDLENKQMKLGEIDVKIKELEAACKKDTHDISLQERLAFYKKMKDHMMNKVQQERDKFNEE